MMIHTKTNVPAIRCPTLQIAVLRLLAELGAMVSTKAPKQFNPHPTRCPKADSETHELLLVLIPQVLLLREQVLLVLLLRRELRRVRVNCNQGANGARGEAVTRDDGQRDSVSRKRKGFLQKQATREQGNSKIVRPFSHNQ